MVTVRFFAGARAAAGVAQESLDEELLPPGGSLDQLAKLLADRHGPRLRTVLGAASFLVDGVGWRDRDRELPPDAVVDVLPPFAGG